MYMFCIHYPLHLAIAIASGSATARALTLPVVVERREERRAGV
jgi:hypothetical protein